MTRYLRHVRWLAALTTVPALGLSGCGSASDAGGTEPAELNEAAVALLPEEVSEAGVLKVGVTPQFPPFAYVDPETQAVTGYDPELVKAIARDLGLEVEFTPMEFNGLIPALESGKIQVGAAGITDKEEREEVATFVPSLIGTQGAMIPAEEDGTYEKFSDLCGKKIGTVIGSVSVAVVDAESATCVEHGLEPMEQLQLAENAAVLLAVESGRADAAMATYPGAGYQAEQNPKLAALVLESTIESRFPNGLAVTNDLPKLAEAMEVALEGLIESGEYAEILEENGVDPKINGISTNEVILNWRTNGWTD